MFTCIRDKRQTENFKDSIVGTMQTNSPHNGPVYFYCFPNYYTVKINDGTIRETLVLEFMETGHNFHGSPI